MTMVTMDMSLLISWCNLKYCRTLAGELRHRDIQTTYSDVGSYEYRLAVYVNAVLGVI